MPGRVRGDHAWLLHGDDGAHGGNDGGDGVNGASGSGENRGRFSHHPEGNIPRNVSSSRRVPVYVMLPLDTVSTDGHLQREDELRTRLTVLKSVGVEGVMVDMWWGVVERTTPGVYDWAGRLIRPVLSFT